MLTASYTHCACNGTDVVLTARHTLCISRRGVFVYSPLPARQRLPLYMRVVSYQEAHGTQGRNRSRCHAETMAARVRGIALSLHRSYRVPFRRMVLAPYLR